MSNSETVPRYTSAELMNNLGLAEAPAVFIADRPETLDFMFRTVCDYAFDVNRFSSITKESDSYRPAHFKRHSTSRNPSEVLKPKPSFYGKIGEYALTTLDDMPTLDDFEANEKDPDFVIPYKQQVHLAKDPFHILLTAQMRSTGRGVVGTLAKIAQVKLGYGEQISVKYSSALHDTGDLSAELLKLESETTVRLLTMRGLANVVSAGLPTLGKR